MSQPLATSSPIKDTGTKKKVPEEPNSKNKFCVQCKSKTSQSKTSNERAFKCNVCSHYIHVRCLPWEEEKIKIFVAAIFTQKEEIYRCSSCAAVSAKLNAAIELNAKNIEKNEGKILLLEDKVESQKEEMEKMNMEMLEMKARLAEVENGLKKNVDSNQQKSTGLISNQVIQEMNQRKQKAKNIILQGVPELNSDVPKEESNAYDKARIKEIFKELDMPSPPDNSLTTATRIGGRSKNKTRPIKLQLCDKTTADKVIGCASRLKNAKDKNNQKVRIEPDLTKGQREAESNVYESCNSKNLSRPQEMIDQRKAHKVVGKKGRKWIAVVELKEKEVVNESGKIMLVQQEETPDKRGVTRDRSRGGTPDAEKKKRTDTEAITSDEED